MSAMSSFRRSDHLRRANTFGGMLVLLCGALGGRVHAQDPPPDVALPRNTVSATFVPAPALPFPNPTDSNSPAVWDSQWLYLFNSVAGSPRRARVPRLDNV